MWSAPFSAAKPTGEFCSVAISVSSLASRRPNASSSSATQARPPAAPAVVVAGQLLDRSCEDRRQHGRSAARTAAAGVGLRLSHRFKILRTVLAPARRRQDYRPLDEDVIAPVFWKGVLGSLIAQSPRWSPSLGSFQRDALRGKFVADAIGLLEVLSRARAAVRSAIRALDTGPPSTPLACRLRLSHCAALSDRKRSKPQRTGKLPCGSLRCSAARPVPQAVQDSHGLRRVEVVIQRFDHGRRRLPAGTRRRRRSQYQSSSILALSSALFSVQSSGRTVVRLQHAQAQHLARPVGQHSRIVTKLPRLFDIFSPSSFRKPLCIQISAMRSCDAQHFDCAISFTDAGTPGRCRRRGCRTARRDASTPSPSTRCASPAGPAP